MYATVFALTPYSAWAQRATKPFNPVLGETYEWASADGNARFLAEQVYGGEDAAAEAQLLEFEKLLLQASRENMDPSAFEAHVGERDLSTEQSAQLVNWWRINRARVHDATRKKTRWAGSLEQLGWRIDVKTAARDQQAAEGLNEPTAIVQMETRSDGQGSTIRFEMDRAQLADFDAQLDEIQSRIDGSAKS